jgi:hypothetical protein
MLHKTTDALALYIGLHYGEEAAKEFTNGKQQASLLPVLDALITMNYFPRKSFGQTCCAGKFLFNFVKKTLYFIFL